MPFSEGGIIPEIRVGEGSIVSGNMRVYNISNPEEILDQGRHNKNPRHTSYRNG